ncbi:hypothetical protein CB0940_03126 [Cercospora beticola]|uniref:Uncharacterized protein n=1 Tax=Cercospora beticola TaxID=122368 RepID=A0A2G5I2W0_CERBT|nr:hypothetical protein CB0940_03126 [Cercospora beticola]PIA99088.1 hypothetical protein CB0940_03126 [Cercospora beticola]WPB00293.1 hypothetical protein RHO25_004912 [Cercospora beticola]CAK1361510.1 unnamed protein product [Cercospora beticola]
MSSSSYPPSSQCRQRRAHRRQARNSESHIDPSLQLEWEQEKKILRESLGTAFQGVKNQLTGAVNKIGRIVSNLQGEIPNHPLEDAQQQRGRPESIADSYVHVDLPTLPGVPPRPIAGSAYRTTSYRDDRKSKADVRDIYSSIRRNKSLDSAARRPRAQRREAEIEDDDESRATLKKFGRRCGALPAKKQQRNVQNWLGAVVEGSESQSEEVSREEEEEIEEGEWAMQGLSVFDDSDDDEVYGHSFACDRIARKLRRQAKKQRASGEEVELENEQGECEVPVEEESEKGRFAPDARPA